MNLTQKYKPKDLVGFIDNKKQIEDLIKSIKKGEKVIVHGPTGIGKTLAVELIAQELEMDLLQLDASDSRSKKILEEKVLPFISQKTLFSKGKIVLFDELEGVSGKDRGALNFIKEVSEKTRYPVVLVTNDLWSSKLTSVRFSFKAIEFKKPSEMEIAQFMHSIIKLEKLDIDPLDIKTIIKNNKNDIRACLNDLESGIFEEREKNENAFDAMNYIFKGNDEEKAKKAFDNVGSMQFSNVLFWVSENIPREYKSPKELEKAYDSLSKADIFNKRIMKRNYWKLLYHAYVMSTVGVMVAKEGEREGYTRYSPPTFISKMFKKRFVRAKMTTLKKAFAANTHCSKNKAKDYIWLITNIYKNNPKEGDKMAKELELDSNIVKWIKGR